MMCRFHIEHKNLSEVSQPAATPGIRILWYKSQPLQWGAVVNSARCFINNRQHVGVWFSFPCMSQSHQSFFPCSRSQVGLEVCTKNRECGMARTSGFSLQTTRTHRSLVKSGTKLISLSTNKRCQTTTCSLWTFEWYNKHEHSISPPSTGLKLYLLSSV